MKINLAIFIATIRNQMFYKIQAELVNKTKSVDKDTKLYQQGYIDGLSAGLQVLDAECEKLRVAAEKDSDKKIRGVDDLPTLGERHPTKYGMPDKDIKN